MARLTARFQTHTFANGLGKKVLQHISYISRGVERYAKEETLKVTKKCPFPLIDLAHLKFPVT